MRACVVLAVSCACLWSLQLSETYPVVAVAQAKEAPAAQEQCVGSRDSCDVECAQLDRWSNSESRDDLRRAQSKTPPRNIIRIGHVSDLHVSAPSKNTPSDSISWSVRPSSISTNNNHDPISSILFSKRITGWLNMKLTRGVSAYSPRVALMALRDLIHTTRVHHTVITGDLTNLALHSEYLAAAHLLSTAMQTPSRPPSLLQPSPSLAFNTHISITPGNHDAYLPSSLHNRIFEQYFHPFLSSTTSNSSSSSTSSDASSNTFPVIKAIAPGVILVVLSSAIPTPWFISAGEVPEHQLQVASRKLARMESDHNALKILALHHPVVVDNSTTTSGAGIRASRRSLLRLRAAQWTHGLRHTQRITRFIERHSFSLVLHGHTHHAARSSVAGAYVFDAGCGSYVSRANAKRTAHAGTHDTIRTQARYNVYEISIPSAPQTEANGNDEDDNDEDDNLENEHETSSDEETTGVWETLAETTRGCFCFRVRSRVWDANRSQFRDEFDMGADTDA